MSAETKNWYRNNAERLIAERRRRTGKEAVRYHRYFVLDIEEVLPLIPLPGERVKVKKYIRGEKINFDTNRLRTYKVKGVVCVKCGFKGLYFAAERGMRDFVGTPHLNLYGIDEKGVERMMTVDHIVPASKGGSNSVSNLQPMCFNCNQAKGNKDE